MSDAAARVLRDAIDRNVAVGVQMPAGAPVEPRRGRLLGEAGDSLFVEPPFGQAGLIESLRRSGQPVAVAFRRGEHDVRFEAVVLRREPAYALGPAATVEAMVLRWPADVQLVQRRTAYRVRLPLDAGVTARAWHVPEGAGLDFVPATPELAVGVRDLSACGMGLVLPPGRARVPGTRPGDRLRVMLVAGDRSIVTTGRVRQPPRALPGESSRVGVDFDGMDRTFEGRQRLAQVEQLVATLQRTEVRRSRAGRREER